MPMEAAKIDRLLEKYGLADVNLVNSVNSVNLGLVQAQGELLSGEPP